MISLYMIKNDIKVKDEFFVSEVYNTLLKTGKKFVKRKIHIPLPNIQSQIPVNVLDIKKETLFLELSHVTYIYIVLVGYKA